MDIPSYIIGMKKESGTIVIDGDTYSFTDDGDGNITVEEVVNNGE